MRGSAHRRPGRRLAGAVSLGAAVLALGATALTGPPAQAAASPSTTLTVEAGQVLRPVGHAGSGA